MFKSFIIAIATYSRIPVPIFDWKEKDMRYVLVFFPFVGLIIGGLLFGWNYICGIMNINLLTNVCIKAAIPILITGGFHIDGFMDTMDAFKSYQSKEKKLEILKDAHIGAFSVIMLMLYGLIYIAALSEITDEKDVIILGTGFILSRALSGISAVTFPYAKKEGSLNFVADSASKRNVRITLIIESILCIVAMIIINPVNGTVAAVSMLLAFVYYYKKASKEFGGITGDTAGYFVVLSECVLAVALVLVRFLYH